MLHQPLGKYSPVVLDIYFDFLLSKNWELYHDDTLSSVCARAYQALNTYDSYMPDNLRFRISKMTEDRWLENYGTYPGLTRVFSFLHRRTSFPSRLDEASAILQPLEPELDQVFRDFFPQLVEFARLEIQDL